MLRWCSMTQTHLRLLLLSALLAAPAMRAAEGGWTHLSSAKGDLPVPGESPQQTGLLAAKIDPKGATDFILSFRVKGPALVWYRRAGNAWKRYVIEPAFLRVEAGGAACDIDGDGDLDVVFGGDGQVNQLWWWENPYPNFDPDKPWTRRLIKDGGANQQHDQVFGDFLGLGKPQLVFWNQKAKTLFIARIPANPRASGPWPLETVFSGQAGENVENAAKYAEGIDAFDVDGDGRVDLLAGNYWFKHEGGNRFRPIRVGTIGGRIRAGKFKPGKYAQIVIGPGDGVGPLRFYECKGNPADPASWQGRDLLERDVIHGHTLDLGDVNGDGNLDIFAAEMAKWTNTPVKADNPNATAWILYGDGKGNFRKTVLVTGHGWHEGKLADVDGDGDLDVINKPYNWETPRIDVWLNGGAKAARASRIRDLTGMELWTYRRELAKDLPGTLALIRGLGFKDIETASFYERTAAEFRKLLDAAGLTCSSIIAPYERLQKDLEGVARDAKAVGATWVLTSSFPHKGEVTAEECRAAARDFNQWGRKFKALGLRFGYHPHGFEFVPNEKGNMFDILLAETEPGLVEYEMDVYWFAVGGADPVRYLETHPRRFTLVHLKDMAKDTPKVRRPPKETSVALGAGQLDWKRIFAAAVKAGVSRYYIEDESPAAPQQVPVSARFLEGL